MDQKIVNFLKWFVAVKERYSLPASFLNEVGMAPETLLEDKEKREKLYTQILPMLTTSSQGSVTLTCMLRSLYEDMGPEDRSKFVAENLVPLAKDWARKAQEVVQFIEENQEVVATDLRTLGAYMTLFTQGYIKKNE